MTVTANGRQVALPEPRSLTRFLEDLNFPPRSVVVELNGEAVAPSEFPDRMIHSGDRVEIVRIVAGG